MYNQQKIVAIIPARGGSKGFPNKNIAVLGDKPLIQWSIEAALKSAYLDKVVVTTDSKQIAEVAANAGCPVPFMRPAQLARDESPIEDAINHTLGFLEEVGEEYDIVILLMATSPFRNEYHIDDFIECYFSQRKYEQDTMVSVVKAPDKMGFLMQGTASGHIEFSFQQLKGKNGLRRQSLPQYYLPNGAMYLAPTRVFKSTFYTENTLKYEMSENDSVDIDSIDDLDKAAVKLKSSKESV